MLDYLLNKHIINISLAFITNKLIIMNLLIPTNDGIYIAPDFDEAHKFRFLSIVNGSVKKDEIRIINEGIEKEFQSGIYGKTGTNSGKKEISLSKMKSRNPEFQYIVIANRISKKSEKKLNENNFEVLLTTETNITNAILYYLKYHATSESDYCCCP